MNLKSISVLFCFLLTLLLACKKDTKTNDNVNTPLIVPDNIYFKDFVPDTTLESVQTMTTYFRFGMPCTAPVPYNGQSNLTLKIKNDTLLGLVFTASQSFTQISVSGCGSVYYSIMVSGSNPSLTIAEGLVNSYKALLLNQGDEIHQNLNYKPYVKLKVNGYGMLEDFNFGGEKYIAIKYTPNNYFTYYGWILVEYTAYNGLKIKEYGFNQTTNNIIKAGQKL